MAIYNTDSASLSELEVSGSGLISGSEQTFTVIGSGSQIFVVSGSLGPLLQISENIGSNELFTVTSGSIDIFRVQSDKKIKITSSLQIYDTGSTELSIDLKNNQRNDSDAQTILRIQNDLDGGLQIGVKSADYVPSPFTNINANDTFIVATGPNNGVLHIRNDSTGSNASVVIYAQSDYSLFGPKIVVNITGSEAFIDTLRATGSLFGTAATASFVTGSVFVGSNIARSASFAVSAAWAPGGAGGIGGSGTTNRIAKFTAATTIGNSNIFDDGTNLQLSGSSILISGSVVLTGSLNMIGNIVATQITGSVQAVDSLSALNPGGVAVLGGQSTIDALSNRISAIGEGISVGQARYVSTANTLATAALTGISGLTVSVSAGVIYQVEGGILYSISAATGNAFGLIWPTANRMAGFWAGGTSVNETGGSTFSTMAFGNFDTADSNSAIWSAAVGIGLHYLKVDAVIDVQTGGAMYPVARSSAAANTMIVARGSYFRVRRIN